MKFQRKLVYLFVLLCFTTAAAQGATCSAIAQQAMAAAQQDCSTTGRNQACYGFVSLQATPRAGVQNFTFSHQGDLVNVADLASLQLTAFDLAKNTWGIALMKLQANLPDTLPGENVTFLLFGDVQIKNGVPADSSTAGASGLHPMQAFYFRTGIGQTNCEGAPNNGILIQTPQGAGKVQLQANGADIQLGSTAYLQAQPGATMGFYVVEGDSTLSFDGKTVDVPAGAEADVPIDENMDASGEPSDPQAYDASDVADLPIEDLPDDITVASPADEQTIEEADQQTELEATDQSAETEATDEALSTESVDTEVTDQASSTENADTSLEPSEPAPSDAGADQPPSSDPSNSSSDTSGGG